MTPNELIFQAHMEVREEIFRELVDQEKVRIRSQLNKPWWHYLCPFVITIKRRDS